jgi:hypothetical protein
MIPLEKLYSGETIILLSIASIGAIFANLIRYMVARSRPEETRPDFDKFYWAWFFLIFPLISVFLILCYLLEGTEITPFLALHIGVTAPLTISALAGITPTPYEE